MPIIITSSLVKRLSLIGKRIQREWQVEEQATGEFLLPIKQKGVLARGQI
jgi:hypothetical protein